MYRRDRIRKRKQGKRHDWIRAASPHYFGRVMERFHSDGSGHEGVRLAVDGIHTRLGECGGVAGAGLDVDA
jgi:hypothetical protein